MRRTRDIGIHWRGRRKYQGITTCSSFSKTANLHNSHLPFIIRSYHKSPLNSLAIRVNVGHGSDGSHYFPPSSNNPQKKVQICPTQIKAANLELEKMQASTLQVLNTSKIDHSSKDSILRQASIALNYWSGRWVQHFHPIVCLGPTPVSPLAFDEKESDERNDEHLYADYGVRQSERLLHWIQAIDKTHPGFQVLDQTLTDNATFLNMIDTILMPTRSQNSKAVNATAMEGAQHRNTFSMGHLDINKSIWSRCLQKACLMLETMNSIHESESNALEEDIASCNAALMVLFKISILLPSLRKEILKAGTQASDASLPPSYHFQSIEEVLERMEMILCVFEKKYWESDTEKRKPNVFAYNFVVSAWARSQLPNGPERAEWYLRRMEQAEDEVTNDGEDHSLTDTSEGKLPRIPVFADVVTYNSVLHAYASSSPRARNRGDEGLNNASQHANSILERMETRYRKNKRPETQPDTLSYSCVLNGFSNAGRANDAQMILDKIMSLSELDEWKACVQPNLICFNTAIDAWAKANDVGGAAEKALALLNKMEELSADNMDEVHLDLQPDTITYSSVISAFARSGRPDAGDRAEELFQRSLRLYQEGNSSLKPDSATFNTVLGALAKQAKALYRKGDGVQSVIERAESLLTRMQEIHEAGDEGVRPCTISYNILLDLYAQIERPEKSAGVLKEMRELYNMGNGHVKPDMYSYNGVLNAWANSKCKEGVTEAEKLLSQMEENANNDNMKPNGVSYNTVMKALAQNLKPSSSSARRIEAMLDSMEKLPLSGKTGIELNSTPYNICIDAWGKSGSKDSIVRAEQILTRMYEMSEKLNTKAILPCTISYTAIINALSKSGNRNAPQHAERLIEEMIGKNVSPGTMTYNSLINCWARTKQNGAAQKAEEVLLRMRELTASGAANVPPDSVSFSTVINAWANEGHGKRAEEILHHLEKMSEINSNLTATNYAYNSAITAWSRSQDVDAAQKALAVLDRMGQMYENGNKDAFPTLHSYHSALLAIAKSPSNTKATEAASLIDRMIEAHEKGMVKDLPNVKTYSFLLNACAYTRGTREEKMPAFKIARGALKKILEIDEGVNQLHFSTFLLACSNLMPPGENRDILMTSVFDECCKRGLVDVKVILNIRRSLSPIRKVEALRGTNLAIGNVSFDDLPTEWRCNAQG